MHMYHDSVSVEIKKKKKNKKKTKTGQVRTRGVNWLRTECLCKFGCETIMSVKSFRAKYVAPFREPSPQTICVSFVMIWLVVTPNIYTKSLAMGNAKVSKLWRHVMLKRHERILQHSCVGIMTSSRGDCPFVALRSTDMTTVRRVWHGLYDIMTWLTCTFSALLALCEGKLLITGEFPS